MLAEAAAIRKQEPEFAGRASTSHENIWKSNKNGKPGQIQQEIACRGNQKRTKSSDFCQKIHKEAAKSIEKCGF
jgi:hypothetical protein